MTGSRAIKAKGLGGLSALLALALASCSLTSIGDFSGLVPAHGGSSGAASDQAGRGSGGSAGWVAGAAAGASAGGVRSGGESGEAGIGGESGIGGEAGAGVEAPLLIVHPQFRTLSASPPNPSGLEVDGQFSWYGNSSANAQAGIAVQGVFR